MRVKSHKLFDEFQAALAARPELSIVQSLASPPRLRDFLDQLDPDLSLDWSGQSFQGMPSLREKIVARMGYAPTCGAENTLVTAGTAEANFLAITNIVQPGDEIIVDVPGWPQPLVLADAIGASLKPLPRRPESEWRFDLEELAELVTANTKLIFICNPNNPTGQLLSEADLSKVINIADRVGAYVLTDEVYRGLEWVDRPTLAVASLYERGISTGSVSKALGLQGLRTGWLVCRDAQVIRNAVVLREDTSEIMNIMGEAITDIALSEARYAAALSVARQTGQKHLQILDEFIASTAGLSWQRPQAGLIGFCRLELPIDADELSSRLLAEPYRTFVMSGSAYMYPNYLRLGAGGDASSELERALDRFAQLLSTLA